MAEVYINVNNVRLIRQMCNEGITHTEKHLLEIMAGYARYDGAGIRPTTERLAQDMGCSRRCIEKRKASLLEKGFIVKSVEQKKGSHKPNVYSLNLSLIQTNQIEQMSSEQYSVDRNSEKTSTEFCSEDLPNSVRTSTEFCSEDLPNNVRTNKYLINNEEVIEQISLASSGSVCSPSEFPNTKLSEPENGKQPKANKPKRSKKTNPSNEVAFSELLSCWPKKERQQRAREEFDKHAVSDEMRTKILKAVKVSASRWAQDNTPYRYIPLLCNWLKEKRWNEVAIELQTKSAVNSEWAELSGKERQKLLDEFNALTQNVGVGA